MARTGDTRPLPISHILIFFVLCSRILAVSSRNSVCLLRLLLLLLLLLPLLRHLQQLEMRFGGLLVGKDKVPVLFPALGSLIERKKDNRTKLELQAIVAVGSVEPA